MKVIRKSNEIWVLNEEGVTLQIVTPVRESDQPTHFGRNVLLAFPYMFVTEPWRGNGVVYIYQWCDRFGSPTTHTMGQFRLQRQIHSSHQHHGFGKALAFMYPFLFITDCSFADFMGALFFVNIERPTLEKLYEHRTPVETTGLSVSVTMQEDVFLIELETIHRETLERSWQRIRAIQNRNLRYHPLVRME
jgi:hypothetical protein